VDREVVFLLNPKKVIYTAMFGGFDDVHDPVVKLHGWDMCFFTNAKLKSNRWNIINVPLKDKLDSIQMSRHYKMFPHLYLSNYDVSLWVDASILIRKPIDEFVDYITDNIKMAVYRHTSSWRQEIGVMNRWCRDINKLNAQTSDYASDGFDIDKKIINGNVILREHNNDNVIQTMSLWWNQFNKYYIKRDQVSLAYSVWKSGLDVNFFPGLYPRGDRNPYFRNFGHKRTNTI